MSPLTPSTDLRPYFDELERFADGQMSLAEQEAFELRLEAEEPLADAYAAYEQLTADLRWAAGHDTLRLRLQALDERMNERGQALAKTKLLEKVRQRRWMILGSLGVFLLLGAVVAAWYFSRPNTAVIAHDWEDYYQPDPGPTVTPNLLRKRPFLSKTLKEYQAGHYSTALHSLDRVPVRVGSDTVRYVHGLILLRQNQGDAAQVYLRLVGARDSTTELAHRARYHLGMAHWQAKETREALVQLRIVAADSLSPYRALARHIVASGALKE
ncbi:hypothetical protein [Hymenobacter sp. IS2118]|uniref:hypothetical protein n=1 Tax=Hymenobacter sp. IS2118 TaxID=1505605 RepID=UPI0005517F20|nr:hypothetical protein [Hymenobacter sp. IS2118]